MNELNLFEVELDSPDDFLKVMETLTRIGIANEDTKTLFQTAHILHKRGRYYIIHFKEGFLLDGKKATLSEDDLKRRNAIISLLSDWSLITPLREIGPSSMDGVRVLSHASKSEWTLVQKYTLGKKTRS